MSVDPQDAGETSKAGALRMRRLARLTPLIPQATSDVHRPTGQFIYRGSTSTFEGHFISSFSPSARPRPLALPPYLGPGKELSISPTGEWLVIFHPAPSTNYQTSEGGTLAIYPSTILSPLALPQNVQPLTTFALPTDVLAIQHIYGDAPEGDGGEESAVNMGAAGDGGRAGSGESADVGHGTSATRRRRNIAKPTYGPHPPSTYSPSQGPAFLVLTSTGVILFHPQLIPPPPGALIGVDVEPQYAYATLKCPLHTRWYATTGGVTPPDIGRVDRGWAGVVRGDEGVWFAYEDTEVHGVLRAEVVIKDGKASLLTTRMPPLPAPSTSARRVQGVMFTSVPQHALPPGHKSQSQAVESSEREGGGGDVNMAGTSAEEGDKVGQKDGALVGIVVVSRTTTREMVIKNEDGNIPISNDTAAATESSPVQVQTQIATYAVQRCEVDIVDAFWEINGTVGEKAEAPSAWDWYSLPQALSDHSLPHNTLILALAPLSGLAHPRAVALLATPPNASPVLTHLDLCPDLAASGSASTASATMGSAIDAEATDAGSAGPRAQDRLMDTKQKMSSVDPELILGISAPCMLSPSAEYGRGGQVGVLDPRKGPVFYALDGLATDAPDKSGAERNEGGEAQAHGGDSAMSGDEGRIADVDTNAGIEVACAAIVGAVTRAESYADVIGAVLSKVPADKVSAIITQILSTSYTAFRKSPSIDADIALYQLQVGLFSHAGDPRLALGTVLCRLREASRLFDACALNTDQGIAFELDAIWPLIPVAEHVISTLSTLLYQLVIYCGQSAWSTTPGPPPSTAPDPAAAPTSTPPNTGSLPPSFILLLHPTLLTLLLRLLSQIRTFKSFVSTLQVPILQPESKYAPAPALRDPRATIVAKERVMDLGWKDGVDIMLWGKGLARVGKAERRGTGSGDSGVGAGVGDDAEAERTALLQLDPSLLGKGAIEMLDTLPCPSELLLATCPNLDMAPDHALLANIDGITFLPLDSDPLADAHHKVNIHSHQHVRSGERGGDTDRRIKCDRCHTRTEALGWTARPGMDMGMYGKRYAAGLGSSVGWNGWRGEREGGCICGGAWTR